MERSTMTRDTLAGIDLLCDALVQLAESAAKTAEAISNAFSTLGSFVLDEHLRGHATDRQWYLMNHGSWKIRKKWRNALHRKVRTANKRKGV